MGGTKLHAGIVAQWIDCNAVSVTFFFLFFFKDTLLWSSMGFHLV